MNKKTFIFIISVFALRCFNIEHGLFSQNDQSIDIKIDGIWSVLDETKNISRLLYLNQDLTCATLCLELNIFKNKAMIHCYKDNKAYEVNLVKNGNNEYELQNKKRSLKFKVKKRIYKSNVDYYLIFYKDDGKIKSNKSGRCFCQNETEDNIICGDDFIDLCKKRAQEFDEEASHEKELEFPL